MSIVNPVPHLPVAGPITRAWLLAVVTNLMAFTLPLQFAITARRISRPAP